MTNLLLPALLGIVALAYIFMPLWAGPSSRTIHAVNYIPGVEELDLDHDLGKIDDAEWKTRRAQMENAAHLPQPQLTNIERIIWNFRRSRRAELALEAEILIARGRKKRS
ncbi:hypothetical protein EON83_09515 [bacterium]|nr:MAG: hypothetical protein EON83_09515 [bacterium]